jgi:hypothetical protein
MTQTNEPNWLVRYAPGILVAIGLIASWMLWGWWGTAFSAASLGLLLWRDL